MAKEKKKTEKKLEKHFIVGLQDLSNYPRPRRANKAIAMLRKFVLKHLRIKPENVLISNQLNQFLWQKGREHPPKKVEIKVIVSAGKANLFLKAEKIQKPKEEKKEEKKTEKKEEKTEEEKAAEEEKERKKKEKKIAEKAAEKAAIKRGKE